MIKDAVAHLKKHEHDEHDIIIPSFNTPLDLACADKKGYSKPKHLRELQLQLLNAWHDKKSLSVSMGSRFGKTETMSYFISWILMQYPSLKVMWVGYNIKVSARFVRNIRRILNRFAPDLMDKDKQTQEYFELKAGGYVLASAPNSSATSYGVNLMVIDDMIKNEQESASKTVIELHQEFWNSSLQTRLEPFVLDDKQYDPIVFAIGTLWGSEDLLNMFHDKFRSYKQPCLDENDQSIWPEVYPTVKLLEKKASMSSYSWVAMYMADPQKRGGAYFSEDWLQVYDKIPDVGERLSSGIFCDPAVSSKSGSDFSAVIYAVLGNDHRIYVDELYMHHKTVFQNIEFLDLLYRRLTPNQLIVENVGFADSLVEGLQLRGVPAMGWKPGLRDKNSRIISQLEAPLETGMILFSQKVLEHEEFRSEYARFPHGLHDDSLDCLAIATELLLNKGGMNPYTNSSQYRQGSRGYNAKESRPKSVFMRRDNAEIPAGVHPYSNSRSDKPRKVPYYLTRLED